MTADVQENNNYAPRAQPLSLPNGRLILRHYVTSGRLHRGLLDALAHITTLLINENPFAKERFKPISLLAVYKKPATSYIMAIGALVRVLILTDITKYLYSKAVDGSFVYNKGKVHKVLATDMEALKSTLMGIFEKHRARKIFIYVKDYNESDPKTHVRIMLNRFNNYSRWR